MLACGVGGGGGGDEKGGRRGLMPRQLLISILNPLPLATTVHIVFTLYQLHVTLLSPLNIMLAFFSYFFFFSENLSKLLTELYLPVIPY